MFDLLAFIGLSSIIFTIIALLFEVADHKRKIKELEDRVERTYIEYLEFERIMENEFEGLKNGMQKKEL